MKTFIKKFWKWLVGVGAVVVIVIVGVIVSNSPMIRLKDNQALVLSVNGSGVSLTNNKVSSNVPKKYQVESVSKTVGESFSPIFLERVIYYSPNKQNVKQVNYSLVLAGSKYLGSKEVNGQTFYRFELSFKKISSSIEYHFNTVDFLAISE
ncbi:MAG: hypothetical protein LBM99_02790 [Bacillales bacterium]|jgi:hypothetical protein|nr:hypothetical protein [Bacillales bacterium]